MTSTPASVSAADNPIVGEVLADLAASPTPYHAVARAKALLTDAGFTEVSLAEGLPEAPGPYLVTNAGSLVAWIQQPKNRGFTVVGAHTDSPNLRVKTKPDVTSAGVEQIGMEIYGGVLLNSWLDRGLGLAGRVSVAGSDGLEERLFLDDRPLMTIPQLAIHLDREISGSGLKLDPQRHLVPMWGLASDASNADGADGVDGVDTASGDGVDTASGDGAGLRGHVADLLDVNVDQILAWDLMAFDTQAPSLVGRDREFFCSARIDNLLSSFCGVRALLSLVGEDGSTDATDLSRTPVLALYDHEEIGSESATGAASVFLSSLLERIALAQGAGRAEYLASLNRSLVISADGAHATHPNYAERHEPAHHIDLNGGVVVKRNANQRYATDAASEAFIVDVAKVAGVPLQYYIHRNDLPCGSTIGPITAARLGVATVDIGAPQLGMHSIRETAGVADVSHLWATLGAAWRHDVD